MYQSELYTRKSPDWNSRSQKHAIATARDVLEFLSFVQYWHTGMHRLHPQNLVVTLFVVEHGSCEIIEHILCCERSIRLNPLMPDEKSVTVIVRRM